jgi:hypothetical protein
VIRYLVFQGASPQTVKELSPNLTRNLNQLLRLEVLSRRSRYLISWGIKA